MDGIGIVQWRDQGESYPFQNAGKFTGILCDASFLSFNGVIPVLQQLKLTPDSLTLTVLTYNGALDFVVAIANAIPDAKAVLRYNNIYYGSVVFGANIVDVTSGNYGTKIATKLSFSPITVRMLNSQAGLYSIN
jgi:hypothetical protein